METNIRLALIGCGALAKYLHLPASQRTSCLRVDVLVDRVEERARQLADQFHVPHVAMDFRDIVGKIDAAIVALPNHLHAPVSIELLRQGIHVLVEKPMAITVEECRAMCRAAKESQATLAVGLVRRFFDTSQFVKRVLESNMLGDLREFDYREGAPFGWPVASDYAFRMDQAGGGVLIDTGAYAMDFVQWWFGMPQQVEYTDDNFGGVEADAKAILSYTSGLQGTVELSRTRLLRNTVIIRGENGSMEMSLACGGDVRISSTRGDLSLAGGVQRAGAGKMKVLDAFVLQFEDFAESIRSKRRAAISGEDGTKSVELIQSCYQRRQPMPMPWLKPDALTLSKMEASLT